MDTLVSQRAINVENPQTGPKTASTQFVIGEWLEYASGLLAPLLPTVPVAGLNLTPVPASSATTDMITFDGIDSTADRWYMPIATTIGYGTLTGTFAVGDTITGGTSGATAKVIKDNGASSMVVVYIKGTFVVGETITGSISGATAIIGSITGLPTPSIGLKGDIAADSISLDAVTVGSGTQFKVTKVLTSEAMVEVAVVLLSL